MVLYLAYGSNMDQKDLDKWCNEWGYEKIKLLSGKKAVLKGFRLAFNYRSKNRKGGVANIMDS